jgi:hypothetical protein
MTLIAGSGAFGGICHRIDPKLLGCFKDVLEQVSAVHK